MYHTPKFQSVYSGPTITWPSPIIYIYLAFICLSLFLTSCRQSNQAPPLEVTVTQIVTPLPNNNSGTPINDQDDNDQDATRVIIEIDSLPPTNPNNNKNLTVCLLQEPVTLYPYSQDKNIAQTAIAHTIYENNITSLDYGYQPQGLIKLPNFSDGDAYWQEIEVTAGDQVVNTDGQIVFLRRGMEIINAQGDIQLYQDEPILMRQLVTQFTLKERNWADGTPVTAADSVFSFELAQTNYASTSETNKLANTAAYVQINNRTTQWTGLPGYAPDLYFLNFWNPYPKHLWQNHDPDTLAATPMANEYPIGDGPFILTEWLPDDHIYLTRNENYYRAAEGLPYLDSLTFKFMDNINQLMSSLLSGQCDLAPHLNFDLELQPFLLEAQTKGLLTPYFANRPLYERLDFGINSAPGYGDGTNNGRPDWFQDNRVRQAVAHCLNRQNFLQPNQSTLASSYLSPQHPLTPNDLPTWPYDPLVGQELLTAAGYIDLNDDGFRQDPQTGATFDVNLATVLDTPLRRQIANHIKADLAVCGIQVTITPQTANTWMTTDGPLFSRRFDLVQIPWPIDSIPQCQWFMGSQIPNPTNNYMGYNFSGWQSPEFDTACTTAQNSLINSLDYRNAHAAAQQIFATELPSLPLMTHVKMSVARPNVRQLAINVTQPSELWNAFELDLAP
ncbi:MAG TPA: ABC transporter substrate-binding protein [Anaerolineae bacterium]|nr:ABC transporter substrate-binding protein [Anaerolineae bacterium]